MPSGLDPDAIIISADVHILDIEPKISRSLELPVAMNFAEFHEVLQAAFGWTDSHLHHFNVGGLIIGAPEFGEDGFLDRRTFEATEVRLQDLVFPFDDDATLTIHYEYDFGDSWRHRIVMRRLPAQAGIKYPRCVVGSRAAPPEDVGGPSGYTAFLEAWHDPEHESHKIIRSWAGKKFDPERFNLNASNKAIRKAIRVSGGDYRFRQLTPR